MQGLVMAGQVILGLSILVVLHEFGHYITARMFGIKVEKFYLFFDAWNIKLFKIKYKDTEYGIGWLPFGGYVKIAGMIDESLDTEQMKQPPQPWEFRSKPAWQRLIVMLGGVFFNVVLGIIIFTLMLRFYNKNYIPLSEVNKDGIYASALAKEYGFRNGDKIVSVNNKEIERFEDVTSMNIFFGSTIQVEREGQLLDIVIPDTMYKAYKTKYVNFIDDHNFKFAVDTVLDGFNAKKAGLQRGDSIKAIEGTPVMVYGEVKELIGKNAGNTVAIEIQRGQYTDTLMVKVDSLGFIGFAATIPYQPKAYTFSKAIKYGTSDAFMVVLTNVKGLGKIFSGEEKARENVQGPIGIAKIYGGEWIWQKFWWLTGLLSMVLAFMNILPIPALDGGHVLIILIETVAGRKIPDKVMEYIQVAGLVIILALMVFVIGNDVKLWDLFFK